MTDIARLRERLHRREARAQVRAEARTRRLARRARQRVDRLRQQATLAGAAARTRYEVLQTGEARALQLARTRTAALAALLPVLLAFGAWSAAGVQAGMVTLLSLEPGSVAAAAAWLVEPALIGVVATIILIRSRLRSVGGDLDERATRIEWGALSLSILLNAVGHWPASLDATAFAALVGHALGPVGAAGTAYLISVIQDGISSADPWHLDDGSPAPSLMGVEPVEAEPEQPTSEGGRPQSTWPVEPPSGASLLPIVAAPEPHSEAPVNLTERPESTSPVNPSSTSPVNPSSTSPVNPTGSTSEPAVNLTGEAETASPVNPSSTSPVNPIGATSEAPVNLTERPESTSPVSFTERASERRESKRDLRKRRSRQVRRSTSPVRRKSVEDRARELDELIRSGELAENSSVNRVRLALRCSPENARRAIEWRRAHLTGEVTGEAVERLTDEPIGEALGEVTGEPPVESGELVDDPTSEVVDVVIDPHELAGEPALTAAR